MTRKYYVIIDVKQKKYITTLLKQDFKNPFYNNIIKNLKLGIFRVLQVV